jgi:hypothetical protein
MMMRQNTRRTAFEMLRRGFSVSEAALQESAFEGGDGASIVNQTYIATSSIPWKEKPACTRTAPNLGSGPWLGFSPSQDRRGPQDASSTELMIRPRARD